MVSRATAFIICSAVFIAFIIIVIPSVVLTREKHDGDMQPNSVDDQFTGCEDATFKLISDKYLPQELISNQLFNQIWKKHSVQDLYIRSIKVYTDNGLYKQFNDAVSSGRDKYISKFDYKSLHFFLTRAIQMNALPRCTEVLRRVSINFSTNVEGSEMRFGRFASTSRDFHLNFASTSCFKIKTCFGADISTHSVFPDEKEVLIPPYEKFKIISVTKNDISLNCKVLYTLESTGKLSHMECDLVKEK